MAGMPLRRIQVLVGHSDYKITEKYAHLGPGSSQKQPWRSSPSEVCLLCLNDVILWRNMESVI